MRSLDESRAALYFLFDRDRIEAEVCQGWTWTWSINKNFSNLFARMRTGWLNSEKNSVIKFTVKFGIHGVQLCLLLSSK